MHTPPRVLVVDDQPMNVEILATRLAVHGYEVLTATNGEEAIALARAKQPDLMLLDVILPGLDGLEVCRHLKGDASLPFLPIIMISAKTEPHDIVAGFDAGADDYLTKPLDRAVLVARVTSVLRLKARHDLVLEQSSHHKAHAAELQAWNQQLEDYLQHHVINLERMGRLKRLVSPQLVEWAVSLGAEDQFARQRHPITIVCCALQGLTVWVEASEPDRVFDALSDYHQVVGPIITQYDGMVERLSGEELLVVFNAPFPCPDPVRQALRTAVSMRHALHAWQERWLPGRYLFDLGIGVAHGEATLGITALEDRLDYTVLGAVRQFASRLADEARGGHILLNQSAWQTVAKHIRVKDRGKLTLKGHAEPMPFFELMGVSALD